MKNRTKKYRRIYKNVDNHGGTYVPRKHRRYNYV